MLTGCGLLARALATTGVLLLTIAAACSGGDDDSSDTTTDSATPTGLPTESPTPAPANPLEAQSVFEEFVAAVQDDDVDTAWNLYTASIPGATDDHNPNLGCSYEDFSFEFPRIVNLFSREVPFDVVQYFGGASPTTPIEIRLTGATGDEYLVTMLRVEPNERYRLRFMNNGRVPPLGEVNPLPSPGDPQGFCGIWNGNR